MAGAIGLWQEREPHRERSASHVALLLLLLAHTEVPLAPKDRR